MAISSHMPSELKEICTGWSREMDALPDEQSRIDYMAAHLPALLQNTSVFKALLDGIVIGAPYPDIRHTDAFDNEILLFLHPKRIFSLRFFLFGPGEFTPVHDHNSWGVFGTAFNQLTVVNYRREDDGAREGIARLGEVGRRTLLPGDTAVTRSLNEGIHKTGNTTQNPMIMVSVYGSSIRRLHVNGFDLENSRVFKMYAPRMKKRLLARETLPILLHSPSRSPCLESPRLAKFISTKP